MGLIPLSAELFALYGIAGRTFRYSVRVSQWGQSNQWSGNQSAQNQWPNNPGQNSWGSGNPWGTSTQRPAGYGQASFPASQNAPFPQSSPGRQRPRSGGGGRFLLTLILVPIAIYAAYVLMSMVQGSGTTSPTTTTQGSYVNEDYQVPAANRNPPELPSPETYSQATTWMEDNAIYDVSIGSPVRCDTEPIDIYQSSNSALQSQLNDFTACLMRSFGPTMEDAGFTPVRPSVTVYTGELRTRCGTMPEYNAAYCPSDQQVYFASNLYQIIPSDLLDSPYMVESVVAHEFGHAIQGRTGILISASAWQQRVSSSDSDEISRRLEVQADCFAGEYVSSVSQSVGLSDQDISNLGELFYSIGDDQLSNQSSIEGDHGHGDTRQSWFESGLGSTSMGTCNSFTVSSNRVR